MSPSSARDSWDWPRRTPWPAATACRVVVVDKEPRVAAHQSSHNSGVIHSGLYYAPGSARARLCVRGREQMVAFCRAHGVAHDVCGKLVVATRDDELPRLEALLAARTRRTAWPCAPRPARDRRRSSRTPGGLRALFVPEAGIADYPGVAAALARRIAAAGGEVRARHAAACAARELGRPTCACRRRASRGASARSWPAPACRPTASRRPAASPPTS